MQVPKLKAYLAAYRDWLSTPAAHVRLPYWETQQNWQTHWDPATDDWAKMYQRALDNGTTRRLWKREAYAPKEMMLHFLALEPDFVRSMFTDLFNETKDAHGRADRFIFFCDQLLDQYRRKYPARNDTSHYHDDGYGIISLYLACQFPLAYAPYTADTQRSFLQKVGAANVPLAGDFPRHLKLMPTLYKFLNQDAEILARHQARLLASHYAADSLLLSFDFVQFVASTPDQGASR
jgi:hypothetical protein